MSRNQQVAIRYAFPAFIAFLALLSFVRILSFRDVYWDDNCWLLAAYLSDNLGAFLTKGWTELRREPLGAFLYFFLGLHKHVDDPFLIWQPINLSVQIATPLVLYFFVKNLPGKNEVLALFVAIAFLAFPLDHTLPYLSAIGYRLSLLLSLISLYLTERSISVPEFSSVRRGMALLISVLAVYVFLEAAVALEAARLVMIVALLKYQGRLSLKEAASKAVLHWWPFLVAILPLIASKLYFKPVGIYEGIYKTDFALIFNREYLRESWNFLNFRLWKTLWRESEVVSAETVALTAIALFAGLLLLLALRKPGVWSSLDSRTQSKDFSLLPLLAVGLVALASTIAIFLFAGRVPRLGMESSHGALMQLGYAMLVGATLYALYRALAIRSTGKYIAYLGLVLLLPAGVYFSNLNLDWYKAATAEQEQFMNAFKERFPVLPETATFLIEAPEFFYFEASDLNNHYDFEFPINLYYSRNADPATFRRYRVVAPEEMRTISSRKELPLKIERTTHFGHEKIDPRKSIFIYYRNGHMLVNDEIVKAHDGVFYAPWIKAEARTGRNM